MNDKFIYLIIAVATFIFCDFVVPILESLLNLIQSSLNRIVGSWTMQLQIEQAQTDTMVDNISQPKSSVGAIGFQIPSEENYDDEED